MTLSDIEFRINISEPDASTAQTGRLAVALMQQLRALGVESVERQSAGPAPDGAKGAGTTTDALKVIASPNLVERVVGFLRTWAARSDRRSVKIETPGGLKLEFTPDRPLSPEQLAAFVQAATSGSPVVTPAPGHTYLDHRCRTQLWETFTSSFSESELRTLCFHLSIDYSDLPGSSRPDKIVALIEHIERHKLVKRLLDAGPTLRHDISWDEICPPAGA